MEEKPCWEKFAVPTVSTAFDGSNMLEFVCEPSHRMFRAYYENGTEITADFLSEFMKRALSLCAECMVWKRQLGNGDNV